MTDSELMETDIADLLAGAEGPLPDGIQADAWTENALLSCAEMGQADRATIAAGTEGYTLMQAAGRAVAEAVMTHFPEGRIAILCGPGNNGGDGFVAASDLQARGREVRVALPGTIYDLQGDAGLAARAWTGPVEKLTPSVLDGCDVVVDAVFGAGLSRPPEGDIAATLKAIGSRKVVSVDVPSGISGDSGQAFDTALPAADVTVTFFREKTGHYLMPGRVRGGERILADIGIPSSVLDDIAPAAALNAPGLWQHALPRLTPDLHKYDRGTVMVTGGPDMIGAACLVARAAQRVGAGLVRVASPVQQSSLYKLALESAVVHAVKDTRAYYDLLEDTRIGCAVIGPGLGIESPGSHERVLAILRSDLPAVIDADALMLFAKGPEVLFEGGKRGTLLLTPHEGEFARLFPDLVELPNKLDRALAAAERVGSPVLLKGYDTVIAAPSGHAVINANAPETLATAGAGDVLCGLAAGLIAGGMPVFAAGCAAVYIHGAAARSYGRGLIASDLPDLVPAAMESLFAPS